MRIFGPGQRPCRNRSSERSHNRDRPSEVATKTIFWPSGEIASDTGSVVGGVVISRRISGAVGTGRNAQHAITATAISVTSANADNHTSRSLRVTSLCTAGRRLWGSLCASSISIRASAMSCEAALRILAQTSSQQISNSRGVDPGNALPLRLAPRTAAIVSETCLAAKRRPPGQHLVEHAAERPDVGALVHGLPLRLLRDSCRRPCRGCTPAGVIAGLVIVGDCDASATSRPQAPAPSPARSPAPSPCRRRAP